MKYKKINISQVKECVNSLVEKYPESVTAYIKGMFISFYDQNDEVDMDLLNRHMQSIRPTKMGGIYIDINRALEYLKLEIKKRIKNGNTTNP